MLKRCVNCKEEKPPECFSIRQSWCKECRRVQANQWYQENKERLRPVLRQRYQKNIENNRKAAREYIKRNKEAVLRKNRAYYTANKERLNARAKAYREANREKIKASQQAWYQKNKSRALLLAMKRRMRKLQLPNDFTKQDIAWGLQQWGSACVVCRASFQSRAATDWDHWIPVSNPCCPGTVPWNMLPLCAFCNGSKKDRDGAEWIRKRLGQSEGEARLVEISDYFARAADRRAKPSPTRTN